MLVSKEYLEAAKKKVAEASKEEAVAWIEGNNKVIEMCAGNEAHSLLEAQTRLLNSLLNEKVA